MTNDQTHPAHIATALAATVAELLERTDLPETWRLAYALDYVADMSAGIPSNAAPRMISSRSGTARQEPRCDERQPGHVRGEVMEHYATATATDAARVVLCCRCGFVLVAATQNVPKMWAQHWLAGEAASRAATPRPRLGIPTKPVTDA